jgi:ABC-2 type transport system ATP-binding protein
LQRSTADGAHKLFAAMSIEVQKVTKKYGSQLAVQDMSFAIGKGEVVGFLGPNGAGKSTMMKIITCFILPLQAK